MPIKDMATTTAAFGFTRTLSGTMGIAIGNAVYSSELRRRLPHIPGIEAFTQGRSIQELSNDVKGLTHIQVRLLFTLRLLKPIGTVADNLGIWCWDSPRN